MKVLLKPKENEVVFPVSIFDVDINYTIDHLISLLTLRFKAIDANEVVVYRNGKRLPYELNVLTAGISENDSLEVGICSGSACTII